MKLFSKWHLKENSLRIWVGFDKAVKERRVQWVVDLWSTVGPISTKSVVFRPCPKDNTFTS